MKTLSLNGTWKMCGSLNSQFIDATVPGTVYSNLLAADKMQNPFWRDNELSAMKLMEQDFTYKRSFVVSKQFLNNNVVRICCEGIDTIADIKINNILALHTNNMHRTWVHDIKQLLHEGENTIEIYLYSPLKFIRKEYQKNRADGSEECTVGFPTIRKAHCQFGWDWGPRLPDAGIWRNIFIQAFDYGQIKTASIQQFHHEDYVTLKILPEIEVLHQNNNIHCEVLVTAPDNTTFILNANEEIVIHNPQLWWPNGFGKQPLYNVTVKLLKDNDVIDTWQRKIGLRTMEMHIEKDQWGECFAHRVNGVDIFAMGADYIPEDSVFGNRSSKRTRQLLQDCALANYNVVRVWGGGFYPDDWFYDICDELGLIVWQDFMFACAVYNLTDQFEENIMSELKDNITRIRHHACIGLLCGNNEMEMFVKQGLWVSSPKQTADYIKMYEYLFPKLVKEIAPQCFYWPASPSSGGSFDEPNAPDRGDVHFWEVWHDSKPFSEYQKHYFRYLSEFGFESFPCQKTIDSFALPSEQNVFSYIMEKHQKRPGANGKIINYLSQTYLYPHSNEMLLYASQLLQAEAVEYGVEHMRRNRGRCMGAVYWQVNDCWPVASWSSIDYYGRWKALHYFAKRFYSPVLLSAEINSALTINPDINQENISSEKTARISVSNETLDAFCGIIEYQICSADGKSALSKNLAVTVQPLTAKWIVDVDAKEFSIFNNYIFYKLLNKNGEIITQRAALFCQPKYFTFVNPQLQAKIKDGYIIVTSKAFAKSVCIESTDTELLLEDNYFDMQPGDRKIKILRGTPETVKIYSVFDIN